MAIQKSQLFPPEQLVAEEPRSSSHVLVWLLVAVQKGGTGYGGESS